MHSRKGAVTSDQLGEDSTRCLTQLQADLLLLLGNTFSSVEHGGGLTDAERDVWEAGQRLAAFAHSKPLPAADGYEWLALSATQVAALHAQAEAARAGRAPSDEPVFIIRHLAAGCDGPGWYARLDDAGDGTRLANEGLDYLQPSGRAARRFTTR